MIYGFIAVFFVSFVSVLSLQLHRKLLDSRDLVIHSLPSLSEVQESTSVNIWGLNLGSCMGRIGDAVRVARAWDSHLLVGLERSGRSKALTDMSADPCISRVPHSLPRMKAEKNGTSEASEIKPQISSETFG